MTICVCHDDKMFMYLDNKCRNVIYHQKGWYFAAGRLSPATFCRLNRGPLTVDSGKSSRA